MFSRICHIRIRKHQTKILFFSLGIDLTYKKSLGVGRDSENRLTFSKEVKTEAVLMFAINCLVF